MMRVVTLTIASRRRAASRSSRTVSLSSRTAFRSSRTSSRSLRAAVSCFSTVACSSITWSLSPECTAFKACSKRSTNGAVTAATAAPLLDGQGACCCEGA
eukprot:gnl/Hemi2/1714_TR610_c0_g1_i1.p1 gnl/Hemi2/1714_TR610_c0_g1~~gnl/Hemi2/1714_TR610_c0_g1_i1.p1  ORF type:complete len:100 (-),score=12.68 gnl/Hemi2/1714_TR610_c0_g1_i1:126-425(-)